MACYCGAIVPKCPRYPHYSQPGMARCILVRLASHESITTVSKRWQDRKLPRHQLLMSRNRPWCLRETRLPPRRRHGDREPGDPCASTARVKPETRFQASRIGCSLERRDAMLVSDGAAGARTGKRPRRKMPKAWQAIHFDRRAGHQEDGHHGSREPARSWRPNAKPGVACGAGGAGRRNRMARVAFLGTRRADRGPATGVGSNAGPFCFGRTVQPAVPFPARASPIGGHVVVCTS